MINSEKYASFSFETKANNLTQLQGRLSVAELCELEVIVLGEWKRNQDTLVERIIERFSKKNALVVRSSALDEDQEGSSKAGAYDSLMGVSVKHESIVEAIKHVFGQYHEENDLNQVLIQPELEDIAVSGVIMSRDLDSGSPYYVLNYDDFSGRTDTVTSGADSKLLYVQRDYIEGIHSYRFQVLLQTVQEIEEITGCDELDIEFGITSTDRVFIFQVRPLTTQSSWFSPSQETIKEATDDLIETLGVINKDYPNYAGNRTVLTLMSDWNPAEMIGVTPKPLALSLYKRLITDNTWASARAEMGYRKMSGHPLLHSLKGRPYIDVRLSLNSFLPVGMSTKSSEEIVNAQLNKLRNDPWTHDKIEFDVALTCYDLDKRRARRKQIELGISEKTVDELIERQRLLTKSILEQGADGVIKVVNRTFGDAVQFKGSFKSIVQDTVNHCIEKGTLPFSIAARHGFIAVSLLRSLETAGLVDHEFYSSFMTTVHTEAADIRTAAYKVAIGIMSNDEFFSIYGHLRPGTYDILSARYDERPDLLEGAVDEPEETNRGNFTLESHHIKAINNQLVEANIDIDALGLLEYCRTAIAARETCKFRFTKTLSNLLRDITKRGHENGFTREELSYLTIDDVLEIGVNDGHLKRKIAQEKEDHIVTRAIRLPYVISSIEDIKVVRMPLQQPNFITEKYIIARCEIIGTQLSSNLDHRIVLTENADPGYDWIFAHPIAGLVTKFGGANSHMAIRCSEFKIPAAIGCGERLFEGLKNASMIELNCANKQIKVVR